MNPFLIPTSDFRVARSLDPSLVPTSDFRLPTSHPGLRVLRFLCVTYCLVLIALGISLYWNLHQAADASTRVQAAYLVGIDDGEALFRARLVRAIIERQLIEESQAKAGREKL